MSKVGVDVSVLPTVGAKLFERALHRLFGLTVVLGKKAIPGRMERALTPSRSQDGQVRLTFFLKGEHGRAWFQLKPANVNSVLRTTLNAPVQCTLLYECTTSVFRSTLQRPTSPSKCTHTKVILARIRRTTKLALIGGSTLDYNSSCGVFFVFLSLETRTDQHTLAGTARVVCARMSVAGLLRRRIFKRPTAAKQSITTSPSHW